MHNKIHNRTLFVAALSVYFGLLIVGAPSQAFAQTQKIVVVSNQNNACQNPSQQAEELLSKGFFVVAVADFVKDVKTLSSIGKFSPNAPFATSFDFDDEIFVDENLNLRTIYGKGNPTKNRWLETAFKDFEARLISDVDKDSRFYTFGEKENCNSSKSKIKVSSNQKSLTVKSSFDTTSAASLANLYNQVFALGVCREKPNAVFYQNTIATFENNQVFIITHLPRAAIDELIKADAKTSEK